MTQAIPKPFAFDDLITRCGDHDRLVSPTLPSLMLTAEQIFASGG